MPSNEQVVSTSSYSEVKHLLNSPSGLSSDSDGSSGSRRPLWQVARCCYPSSACNCKCCIIIVTLLAAVVISCSVAQLRPVWPLRAFVAMLCQPLPPEGLHSHVHDRIDPPFTLSSSIARPIFGLNLPPQQGNTNQGNFLGQNTGALNPDGSYNYEYTDEQLQAVRASFGAIRLGFNVNTARNLTAVGTIKHYFEVMKGRGGVNILAMWDTIELWEACTPLHQHGNGRINNAGEAIEAWRVMFGALGDNDEIMFEVFNEPFGYWTISGYFREMLEIIDAAGLPHDRVILSGLVTFRDMLARRSGLTWLWAHPPGDWYPSLAYYPNLAELSLLGWQGAFSYHFYNLFVPQGDRSFETFKRKFVYDVESVLEKHQIHVTEIGASLRLGYDGPSNDTRDTLLGFQAGLREIRARGYDIASAHWWCGMGGDIGDAYNVLNSSNDRSEVEALASQINRNYLKQA